MQLDHLNLYVSDLPRSRSFYTAIFQSSTMKVVRDVADIAVGFGRINYAELAIVAHDGPIQSTHFAFRLDSHQKVDAAYKSAIDAGALCNGKPAIRAYYHEHYYGAFVRDPDGHNLEFVCHEPVG